MTRHGSPEVARQLADGKWRLRHSLWMVAPVLGFGFLSWVGFLYCAIRMKTARAMWIRAAAFAALGVVIVVLMEVGNTPTKAEREAGASGDTASSFGAFLMLGTWVLGVVVAVFANREYLRWHAERAGGGEWWRQTSSVDGFTAADAGPSRLAPPPMPIPQQPPGSGTFVDRSIPAGLPQSDMTATAPWATGPAAVPVTQNAEPARDEFVDVNATDVEALAAATGLTADIAAVVVSTRDQVGGFDSFEDLVAKTRIAPHHAARLRGVATFGPGRHRPPPGDRRTGGRVLDL